MTTILVACPEFEPYLRPGLSAFPSVEVRFCAPQDVDTRLTPEVTVLVAEALPPSGPNAAGLRWLHLLAAGYDRLLGSPLPVPDLRVTNSSGGFTTGIAEFVLMRLLMHAKRAEALSEAQRNRTWIREAAEGRTLRGKSIVIVGDGSVGREVGRLCEAFGMKVRMAGRSDGPSLALLVGEADYVVIAASLNATSRRMVDARLLASMRRRPYLVNIGRGALLETAALVDALQQGILSGAALDVFEQEPLPPDSPLWNVPGLTISPHTAGVYEEVWQELAEVFFRNLDCYLHGKPLPNRISLHEPEGPPPPG